MGDLEYAAQQSARCLDKCGSEPDVLFNCQMHRCCLQEVQREPPEELGWFQEREERL